MNDWYADETFWETFYPALFPDERFAIAGEQVDKLLRLVGFEGRAVLDLACGPGRHAVALAERGFAVTGVDLSPFLLTEAKRRAAAAGVEIEWVNEDMRRFRRPGAFDLALSLFTSFGYFENADEDVAVLRNVFHSLAEGGAFLIDVAGKEVVARRFRPTDSTQLADGRLMIERREIDDAWGRIRNRWILLEDGKAAEYRFHHTLYSARELRDLLERVGFARTRFHGSLGGSDYGPEAERLIAIAWR